MWYKFGAFLRLLHLKKIGTKFSSFISPKGNIESSNPEKILESVYPDKGSPSICHNQIDKNPKWDIQVIIPVYNTAKTLEKCIDSVLQQDGRLKILLTIINDGSPDESGDILERYRIYENIDIIHQENRGLSGARNSGLKELHAKYVCFLDSDDSLPTNALIDLYNKAEETDADIVQGGYNKTDIEGNIRGRHILPDKNQNGKILGYPWGKIIKSELFENLCFPDHYWFEDTLFGLIIFPKATNISSISSIVYNYAWNPDGITSKSTGQPKLVDTYWVTKQLYLDRVNLGIPFNCSDYKVFLNQVIMNHSRVKTYGSKKLEIALLAAHNQIMQKFFPNIESSDKFYNALIKSIKELNWNQFSFLRGLYNGNLINLGKLLRLKYKLQSALKH